MTAKAQSFSTEVVLSLSLFFFILITMYWFYANTAFDLYQQQESMDLARVARISFDTLFNQPGVPLHWYTYNLSNATIISVGLTNGYNQLMPEKLSRTYTEDEWRMLLFYAGLRGDGKTFHARIFTDQGGEFSTTPTFTIGTPPPSNTDVHVVQSLRTYENNTIARVVYQVYRS